MKKLTAFWLAFVLLLCSVCSVAATSFQTDIVLGDIDNNGKVEVTDATYVQRYIAKLLDFDATSILVADVDGDGKISVMDCTSIQQFVAKMIDKFPAQTDTTEPTEVETDSGFEPETQAPTTPVEDGAPSEYELEVLRLVNIEREKVGAQPLEFGYFIYDCAKLRAKECDSYFSHTRPDGTVCFTVFEELGVEEFYSALGENIAWGHRTPEQVMNSWMNSPGHRENILSEDFDYIAIGAYECTEQPGSYVTVQLFWGAW